ncbi:hypothetical protein ACIGO8_08825 [Streptomyces sp. NPDC053493]|uniref:hypothetical protein n=1 Tax=Streptomyces sp. NPDC053493 TaxID=3365705 RepID=UPI0037CDAF64
MTYRRAAIPAVAGGLLLTALLWWAGASGQALRLPGSGDALGGRMVAELQYWLAPWSYDPPAPDGYGPGGPDAERYLSLHSTGMQIRFAAVFVFFVPGALLLLRRLPPVRGGGRTPAALLALWTWGLVAGTLAVTVSAPWLIAAQGHGSYRFLPQLAGVMAAGRQILTPTALLAAAVTVALGRVTAKGAGPVPRPDVPARRARLAATAGTAVVALSLVVLSYESVAGAIQAFSPDGGPLAEPGDLLRQLLLLGGWTGPGGAPGGGWLLQRLVDALVLLVVWWALRLLPGLLTRITVPAMAAGAVCATVLGLLVSQLLRMATDGAGPRWGLVHVSGNLGHGVPAALVWGTVAGTVAALILRPATRDTETPTATATGAEAAS